MRLIPRTLAPAVLLLVPLSSPAAHLDFTLTATLTMSPYFNEPLFHTITFSIDEPVTAVQPAPGVALRELQLLKWTIDAVGYDTALTWLFSPVAWFRHPTTHQYGVEVRLAGAGLYDEWQFTWLLPESPYDGSDTAPDFKALDLQSLDGEMCYRAAYWGPCRYTTSFLDGSYTVAGAAVPEPATAWLLLPGLAGLAGWRRRVR